MAGKFDAVGMAEGAIGGLGDGLISLGLGAIQRHWANQDYEKRLRDQERLIDEERAYNDFDSVMRRASNAGVNPLHALGVGAVSGGTTSVNTPDIAAPDVNPLNVSGVMDAAMQREQIRAQRLANEYAEQTLGFRVSLQEKVTQAQELSNQLSSMLLDTEKLKQNEIKANTAFLEASASLQEALENTEEQLLGSRRAELDAKVQKMLQDAKSVAIYNEQAADLFKSQIDANCAAAFQAYAQGRLARIESGFVAQDSLSRRISADAQRDTVKTQKEYNDAVIELQQRAQELAEDRLNVEKQRLYIDACARVLTIVAGAGVGFFLGGPSGMIVGAAAGAGVPVGNPFEVSASRAMSPPSNPMGFR